MEGPGYRVRGARLDSFDPQWKYVNIRRYFNYLESSIDSGTQWAVFEPNDEGGMGSGLTFHIGFLKLVKCKA